MRRVILESPYAGDVERNVHYARAAMRDCLRRGESPLASHLLYTQEGVLDDADPEQRRLGIAAGFAWRPWADATVFYVDLGFSGGMIAALDDALNHTRAYSKHAIEIRRLGADWAKPVQKICACGHLKGSHEFGENECRAGRIIAGDQPCPCKKFELKLAVEEPITFCTCGHKIIHHDPQGVCYVHKCSCGKQKVRFKHTGMGQQLTACAIERCSCVRFKLPGNTISYTPI